MLPSRHILVSFPLGLAVGLLTKSFFSGLLCFLSGTLIDIDHFIDYFIHFGFRLSGLKKIYLACKKLANRFEKGEVEKLYLFFHAIEFAILLWIAFVVSANSYCLAIALGYSVHLLMDIFANIIKPGSYSLIFRIKNGFRTALFLKDSYL